MSLNGRSSNEKSLFMSACRDLSKWGESTQLGGYGGAMNNYIVVIWIKKYISFFGKFFSPIIPFVIPALFLLFSNFFSDFQLWKIIIVILLFLSIIFGIFKIKEFYDEYEGKFSSLIRVLENDLQKKAEEINKRPARMAPDNTQTDFSLYQDLIIKIKTKGFLDFYCQNMECEINYAEPLALSAITPGMHQFFMVLNYPFKPNNKGYFRIYNEFMVRNGFKKELKRISTYRDFTFTIYNDMLPILGNLSELISEKLDGPLFNESQDEHYLIYQYKFKRINKKKKERIFRIRIFI